ncbi:MAG TPA: hypothetical protein VF691_21395 [Cytophagaceae bacterium]|jgi:hypothetical protein
MLKDKLKIVVISLMILGCENQSSSLKKKEKCIPGCCNQFSLLPHYYEEVANGDKIGYEHYLYLDKYQEGCFNYIDFVKIANEYKDTCKNNTPINGIYFLKSVEGFNAKNEDLRDWNEIEKNLLLGLYYNTTGELSIIKYTVESEMRKIRLKK